MTLDRPPGAPPRLHRARRRMRIWLIGIAGAVVGIVVVTAILGGFRDRSLVKVGVEDRGTAFDTGEILLTVSSARISETAPGVGVPREGERWLIVDAVLENHTDDPVSSSIVSPVVGGATYDFDQAPTTTVRREDDNSVGQLQPDLPTRIAWVWPIEAGARILDSTISVGVLARARSFGDPVFDDSGYGAFEPVARVDLPLTGAS